MRVITRSPALERALARFDGWWSARSRREQVMLAGLALFLGAMVLVFGIIRPLHDARGRALADIRTYETITARMRAAGTLTPGAAQRPQRTGSPSVLVNASAEAHGVAIAVEPLGAGARATAADASYDAVVAWLADVGATTPLRLTGVTITRRPEPGRVSATVEVAP